MEKWTIHVYGASALLELRVLLELLKLFIPLRFQIVSSGFLHEFSTDGGKDSVLPSARAPSTAILPFHQIVFDFQLTAGVGIEK